jgi:hypothetical protein
MRRLTRSANSKKLILLGIATVLSSCAATTPSSSNSSSYQWAPQQIAHIQRVQHYYATHPAERAAYVAAAQRQQMIAAQEQQAWAQQEMANAMQQQAQARAQQARDAEWNAFQQQNQMRELQNSIEDMQGRIIATVFTVINMKNLFIVLALGFVLTINGLSHGTGWVITQEAKRLGITKDWMELTTSDIDKLSNKQACRLAKIEREMWGSGNPFHKSYDSGLPAIKTKNCRDFLKQASVIFARMLKSSE